MSGKLDAQNMRVLENNEIEVLGEYDALVIGGGPAGIAAALSAARHGLRVMLFESYGFLGGMWTMGMVNPFFDSENKGGICAELVDLIDSLEMSAQNGPNMWCFDIETMKVVLDRLIRKAGVDVLFHTNFSAPILDGKTIRGVIVENKGGRSAYLGKIVIDCTGDGDVAARCGAPYEVGDENGIAQPMTLMFRMSNMDYIQDYYAFPHYQDNELIHMIDRAMEREGITDYPFNYRRPCVLRMPGAHTAICQSTHIREKSALDPYELTAAEFEGREEVQSLVALLRRFLPQFKNVQLDATGPHIGIRESRRILGEYYLTEDDIQRSAHFEDGICTATFWIDIHQSSGKDQNHQKGSALTPHYQIPYRSLVPREIDNLLVAGRCISGSFKAHASYRVTGNCVAMGQAAGVAARLCVEDGIAPRALDGSRIVPIMLADGAKC